MGLGVGVIVNDTSLSTVTHTHIHPQDSEDVHNAFIFYYSYDVEKVYGHVQPKEGQSIS